MLTVYLCFLAGGCVLPVISFFAGFLGDGADTDLNSGMDVDAGMNADTILDGDTSFDTDVNTGDGLGQSVNVGSDVNSVLSIGLLPTSLLSLSALAISFGAVGAIMTTTGKGKIITFIVAVVIGYIASVVVQSIIKTLKKVQTRSYGIDVNELLLYDGKIIDTILPGQLGTVSFVTLNNVTVSYPARGTDKNIRLETGKIVKAIEFKDGIFLVEPKNKYE